MSAPAGAVAHPAGGTLVAVAIFAKAPVPGRVKTRLVPPLTPEEAASVAAACLEETLRRFPPAVGRASFTLHLDGAPDGRLLALAASLGIPVIPQADGDLGVRLESAFRSLGAGGAAKTLAIGSDSPTLDPAWIGEAIDALDASEVVLGPSEDGGYYLIGTRGGESDAIFDGIPWGTSGVTDATLARLSSLGLRCRRLREWYDVDDAASLTRALEEPGVSLPALERAAAPLRARLGTPAL
jgi:hypothetical protein